MQAKHSTNTIPGAIEFSIRGLWLLEAFLGGTMLGVGGGKATEGNGGTYKTGDEIGPTD